MRKRKWGGAEKKMGSVHMYPIHFFVRGGGGVGVDNSLGR